MDRHHAVPLLDGDVLNVVGTSDSGVVDENIYAAQRRDATFDQPGDLLGFADVGLDGFAFASRGPHLSGDLLGRFLLLRRRVVNDDVRALAREG